MGAGQFLLFELMRLKLLPIRLPPVLLMKGLNGRSYVVRDSN